ncbi:hypothetical protein NEUTE1DRAFT_82884 [Neurospora tetrasperma FGSC 2508]|uniref:Uncharacterized protein n=1 Tax=Neurospora tetrasperma (strain FGSC 2508 / ATCC MYA-4615 / P0657) TaxID=510951 RepID=F8MLN3_NEUT8|nr:uncharacterized protein NEUTE1DRAFT_82884 [Neurospora tetrasperma FGSC 2508]EGO58452.1 hypothetical protein NEUTE1DRAFT_82884 [Neurospora tetrasperma FGSC 2508]
MRSLTTTFLLFLLFGLLVTLSAAQSSAKPESSTQPTSTAAATSVSMSIPPTSSSPRASSSSTSPRKTTSSKPSATATVPGPSGTNYGPKGPPDVLLHIPELHVGRIELDVNNLRADIALAAEVASLVQLNAGVQVGIDKVNITIADVDANLDLVIRLGNLVKVVNRTLSTLDLNPALINLIDGVVDAVDGVIGAVDGLLGSVVQGDSKVNFLIDNLGNIVQEVVGGGSTIVGNYLKNMTFTGTVKDLGKGLTQKTYKYEALGSLVNVVTNALGQVVQAVVVGAGGGGGGGSSSSSSTVKPTSSTTASVVPTSTSTA